MGFLLTENTAAGNQLISLETKAFQNRTIYLEGDIDEISSLLLVKQIIELNRDNNVLPIRLVVSSSGGSVIHGLAIYDAMRSSKAPIETYCIATAYSMGALLFAAGDKRYILENSKVMIHEPLIQSGVGGNASSIKSVSDSLNDTKAQINKILCELTGKTEEEMNKATSYDHFFTAKEAIDFNLADEIVGIERLFM